MRLQHQEEVVQTVAVQHRKLRHTGAVQVGKLPRGPKKEWQRMLRSSESSTKHKTLTLVQTVYAYIAGHLAKVRCGKQSLPSTKTPKCSSAKSAQFPIQHLHSAKELTYIGEKKRCETRTKAQNLREGHTQRLNERIVSGEGFEVLNQCAPRHETTGQREKRKKTNKA